MSGALRFDEASLLCEDEAPGETLLRSTDIGWTSLLANLFRCDVAGGAFDTRATTDQRISLVIKGELDIDVLQDGVWNRSRLRPGSALIIPGGHTQRMRWSCVRSAVPPEIMHLYLPRDLVSGAEERCSSNSGRQHREAFAALSFHDPVIATVGGSLLNAIERRMPDFYAETAARWLATYLTCGSGTWASAAETLHPDLVVDANVARAVRYMRANLARPLTLDILASEAGISKFHFSRRFKKRTGATPFSYLLALRLEAGRRMLADTDDRVGRIANACGYERGSHFGTAFAKRYGETPSDFRRRSRS